MLEKTNKDGEILRLKKEIEKLKKNIKKQRYGLVWVDVPEAFEDDVENKLPILKEVPDLEIKNKDDKPQHILIEGDNYHALTCLNYTHKGKIDVIYIDPPYNTGSDSFKYKDKRILDKWPDGSLVDKNNPYRHSYWLSFMSKRLELARELLNSKGVIFISIDDNEIAQLKLLCNQVFGENNFIAQFTVQTNPRGSQASKHVADVHEYLLLYAKSEKNLNFGGVKKDDLKEYNLEDKDGGKYRLLGLRQRGGEWRREQRPKMYYPIYVNPKNGKVSLEKDKLYSIECLPKRPSGEEGRWTWSKQKFKENTNLLLGKKVKRKGDDNFWDIFRKDFLENQNGEPPVSKVKTIWIDKEINYQNGRTELKNIFNGDDIFDYPKPTYYIKQIISLLNCANGKILDFFAGSGTTGNAVLQLNAEDGGGRQFILVTNDEEILSGKKNRIMSDVCLPRLKNNIKNYGGSAKYYKTDFIGKNNILFADDKDKAELAHNAGELLAIAENTLNQEKSNKYYQIFKAKNDYKYTAVYFREELDKFDDFIDEVLKIKGDVAVYMFSWEDNEEVEEFEDYKNITVKTIPKPILEIYKQIYNLA